MSDKKVAFAPGDQVIVVAGSWKGCEGTVKRVDVTHGSDPFSVLVEIVEGAMHKTYRFKPDMIDKVVEKDLLDDDGEPLVIDN